MITAIALLTVLSLPVAGQTTTERTILIADGQGNLLTTLKQDDRTGIRLTDQVGQSIALRAADDPAEGFIEIVDEKGRVTVFGTSAPTWMESVDQRETKDLITTIILQVSKGVAIIVALLILRQIVGSIGKGVEEGSSRAELLKRVCELEAELADLEVAQARKGTAPG